MNYYNYFTEIEEHFVRRRGKHLLVSPMDWSLISTWRESGIPLHVALRGIDRAMDSFFARSNYSYRKVHSLFYCHEAVMEEYTRYLQSRVGESSSGNGDETEPQAAGGTRRAGGPGREEILDFVAQKVSEIGFLVEKRLSETVAEAVDRVLGRLREIAASLSSETRVHPESVERDLGILDEVLTEALSREAGPELLAGWEAEAKKELKVYKKRLPKETFEKILKNYLRGRIHRHYEVGELSLFHL